MLCWYYTLIVLFRFRAASAGDARRELFGGQPVPNTGGQVRSAAEDPTEAQRVHDDAAGVQQLQGRESGHIATRGAADVRAVLVVQRQRVRQRRRRRQRLRDRRLGGRWRGGVQVFGDGDHVVVGLLGRDEQQVHADGDVLHRVLPVHDIGRRRLPVQHLRRRQSHREPVPQDARVPSAVPRDIRRAEARGRGQGRGRAASAAAGREVRRIADAAAAGRRERRRRVRHAAYGGGGRAQGAAGHAGLRDQPADRVVGNRGRTVCNGRAGRCGLRGTSAIGAAYGRGDGGGGGRTPR